MTHRGHKPTGLISKQVSLFSLQESEKSVKRSGFTHVVSWHACHLVLTDHARQLPLHPRNNKQPLCHHVSLILINNIRQRERNRLGEQEPPPPVRPSVTASVEQSTPCGWWGERKHVVSSFDRTHPPHSIMALRVVTVVPCAYKDGIWLSVAITWVYE